MAPEFPGAKVKGAVDDVQQPRVEVELGGQDHHVSFAFRQRQECLDAGVGLGSDRPRGERFAVVFGGGGGGLLVDRPDGELGGADRPAGVVQPPALPVPAVPPLERVAIVQVLAVLGDEPLGVAVVGPHEAHGSLLGARGCSFPAAKHSAAVFSAASRDLGSLALVSAASASAWMTGSSGMPSRSSCPSRNAERVSASWHSPARVAASWASSSLIAFST